MEAVNGSYFKLIYTDWYIEGGERKPHGNGTHPAICDFIQDTIRRDLKIDWFEALQNNAEEKVIKFGHSELINYFGRNFKTNIISSNQILDDEFTYIYPIEIKATLSGLNDLNKFKIGDTSYEYYFKDIIPIDVLNHLKSGKVKILINITHDPLYDENNIRKFEIQLNELGIDGSDIIFLGGSKFVEYYEKHPESKVKIYNGHLFIRGYVDQIKEFPCVGNLGYVCELFKEEDLNPTILRKNKFICPNRTMEKPQRAIMGYFALKYNLLKEGMFTFIQKTSKNRLKSAIEQVYNDTNENINKYTSELEELLPYEEDTNILTIEQKSNFGSKNNKKSWYSDSYFHLVTETFFGPNVFLSEKIFKPVSNLQPFIVFGDYLTLAELRKLGFKTFEPFIDESYDLEKNPKKRILLLEKELLKLKNMTIEEIHNWYYSIVDILLYNQKHLYTFEKYECFDEIFGQIKIDYTTQKHTQWNLQEKKLL